MRSPMFHRLFTLSCLTDIFVLTPLYGFLAGMSGGMGTGSGDVAVVGGIIGAVFALVPGWWIYATWVLGVFGGRDGTTVYDAHPSWSGRCWDPWWAHSREVWRGIHCWPSPVAWRDS